MIYKNDSVRRTPVVAEAFGGRIKIFGFTILDHRDMMKVRAWAEELKKLRY